MKNRSKVLIIFILISATIGMFFKPWQGTEKVAAKASKKEVTEYLNENFVKSASDFSIELFKNTADSKNNVSISPLSAYIALGLTLNGADGKTKDLLDKELNKYELKDEELNSCYKLAINDFTKTKGNTKFNIANSIWYSKDFKIRKDFLNKNARYFNAQVYGMNFKDKNATKKINKWIKNKTNKLIDKMINKIEPDSEMYVINAIYFKGRWKNPFETTNTFKGNFQGEKRSVKVKFMKDSEFISFAKTEKEEAVILPYDDNRFAFMAVMPAANISINDYINSFEGSTIKNIRNRMNEDKVTVELPKFTSEFEISLNSALKSMGLNNLFNKNEANFSKMYYSENHVDSNLCISNVKHKTFIKVDEAGTKAAAATEIEIKGSSAAQNKHENEIKFNHPFIYMIIDTRTSIPVFMGTVRNLH